MNYSLEGMDTYSFVKGNMQSKMIGLNRGGGGGKEAWLQGHNKTKAAAYESVKSPNYSFIYSFSEAISGLAIYLMI